MEKRTELRQRMGEGSRSGGGIAVMEAVSVQAALPATRLDDLAVENALNFAQSQLNRSTTELSTSQFPKSTNPDGTWSTVAPSGSLQALLGWTQGFFPGLLWALYDRTKSFTWRQKADAWTRPLEAQQANMLTHDNGFKFTPSFVQAYRLTGDPYYRKVALSAAGAMASRYNPKVGIISCCDWEDRWQLPLVVDTMMNLELLFWGATENQLEEDYQGQEGWRDMALNHALKTLADIVGPEGSTLRQSGSTYHVVDYDPFTGSIRFKETLQGTGANTTWSRGQAWAMYGFTMAHRYTGDARMLDAAQRTTDYYLSKLPSDGIPNWDFDSPELRKDSSAAAVAASALLELSTRVTDPARQQRYWDAALRTLTTLMSPAYLAQGTSSRSILLHGVGNYPARTEVDVGLIYGDYYFVEALTRYRALVPGPWFSRLNFPEALHGLGPSNTGLRTIEFDVTPLAAPIDGVVGYADTSVAVTSYSNLAMLVRMNPNGIFDVRTGATYGFVNRVAYTAGTRYHVRIAADLPNKRYSVWVRSGTGAEIQLANNYDFRSDAPPTDDIGQVAVKSGVYDNEFKVENHTVR